MVESATLLVACPSGDTARTARAKGYAAFFPFEPRADRAMALLYGDDFLETMPVEYPVIRKRHFVFPY